MKPRVARLVLPAVLISAVLLGIFAMTVLQFRTQLLVEIRQTIIERDAVVMLPIARRQLAQSEPSDTARNALVASVLESAQQTNMLGVAVFDAAGRVLRFAPDSLLFAELPLDDHLQLLKGEPISRYHAQFALGRYFAGMDATGERAFTPVLEVLLPLHGRDPENLLGFAQYYIDARHLAEELARTDERVNRQTAATLLIGGGLIVVVLGAAFLGLHHAQRLLARRNEQLVRTHFELSLAAKASALGQITSHLIHGLQGPVTSLRAVVATQNADHHPDWEVAAGYAERMQAMIEEAVAMLGDTTAHASYELSGHELVEIVRRRHAALAAERGVLLSVTGGFDHPLDSHRGGILCLITSNLLQNALQATPGGREVAVMFRNGGQRVTVLVSDEGPGIPPELRERLFEPGRSGRPGGSGLGLAISQLLARQIGAELTLASTGPDGTVFQLTLPLISVGS